MEESDQDKPKILSKNLFPVVGIGASAGGLDAFKKLIKAIPVNSGMAYIIVQHLHPGHESALPEILQRETSLDVHEISDNVEVKPDQIYIIPSNKILVATDGILQLDPRPTHDRKNMPIDIFFTSLAEVHQSHAIGIVLSGTGSDGTLGLKKIKDQGGITFVQDLETAAYEAMPQSAIDADVVDFILAPEKMPQQLLQLSRTFKILSPKDEAGFQDLTESGIFKQIIALLRVRKGVDFTYYKQTTIQRRILRRQVILKLEKPVDYLNHLKRDKIEQDKLFYDLLIPVTGFFRDPKVFENLKENLFPEIIKTKSSVNPLRIWIAGCSTGEEAYSIGISLYEYLSDKVSTIKIQIFATDISEKSINKARGGGYLKRELEGVTENRLQEYFTKVDGSYFVKKRIRDMCVFATHNFLKDPPFAKIDFISCRNVLIYMEPFLQKKAFAIFHYALNDKGYLLLGRSETTSGSSELFLQAGKKEKLYTRKSYPGRTINVSSEKREESLTDKDFGIHSNESKKEDFQKNADNILLSKYTPAAVVVNEQLDIVQFRGSTGDFLEPSPGKASLNLLKMARDGLSFELRNALNKSKSTHEVFVKEGILINQGKNLVTIEVVPLLNTADLHFLILFKHDSNKIQDFQDPAAASQNETDAHVTKNDKLEKDLLQAREDMRSITEDQEAANEELQSANEELMSGSEELQSLNEELETSKEELQSTNEELITVNQELLDRNEQINHAKIYAEAIFTTIHEPLLVLTRDFKVNTANNSFYKTFACSEHEVIGKVLFDLKKGEWNIPELKSKLERLHNGNEKFLEWELTCKFPAIGERSMCFNAQHIQKENGENWIMLTFNDITFWKEKEIIEKKISRDLKVILETLPQITSTVSSEGTSTYFNQFYLDYTGQDLQEAIDNGWDPIVKPDLLAEFKNSRKQSIATGNDLTTEIQIKRKIDDAYRWHLWRAVAIRDDEGNILSWVCTATDIHDQKNKEEAKDEFISIASHELKTPLTTAKVYLQLLQLGMEKTNNNWKYIQKASASIDRLNELTDELLDLGRIQNGKLDLKITSFDFNEMLDTAIESVQAAAPKYQITKAGILDKELTGDKERLKQVIINLLTNAVKYSPDATKILVSVEKQNEEVLVGIKDSGIGIRQENLEKIFERYYREEEQAKHFPGLGIGLTICFDIIQRHHGKIWAVSEQGSGSTFYFKIPI